MDLVKGTINDLKTTAEDTVQKAQDAVATDLDQIKKFLSSYKVVVTVTVEPK
jgi:hypothetical protein